MRDAAYARRLVAACGGDGIPVGVHGRVSVFPFEKDVNGEGGGDGREEEGEEM